MAKSDAEISLKVNMPPPSDFQKMLERANKIIADNKKQLEEYRKTVVDVAEGVRIMEQRARATGSAEMVKTARGRFNEGWKTASTLDVREAAISKGLGGMESRLAAVQAAKDAGKITDEEAVALLAKYTEELNKASEAVGELGYALEVTKGDLFAAADFDEMLGKFDAFKLTMQDTGGAARAFAAEMRGQADAFADEREALDASMPGYEQAVAKLMQLEKEYRGLANAADAVTGTLDTSQQKVKEALDAYDGSAEAQKKVYEAIDAGSKKAIDADKKLQSIAEQRGLNEQKRAADAEKAAQKEAEAAAKRAKAEEERARKEEEARLKREQKEAEAAAKREAREEAMAKRDAERFEREQFQMKISALSKQELIKVLDDLRKAREAASKADDAETYAKRTREFNMAREQMERTNAALNVQKMMFLQQAQAVQRMGSNMGELGEKIANIGDAAKNGELDLVGMAEGVASLVSQFQAGLGPVGWFMLALQSLQSVMNKSAKAQLNLTAGAKKTTEELAAVAAANDEIARSVKVAVQQENLADRLNELKAKYASVNMELDTRIRLLNEATKAESKDKDRMAAEEEHQRNLLRMELERRMLTGDISREDYDQKLLDFRFEADVKGAQREAEKRRAEAESAKKEAEMLASEAKTTEETARGKRAQREGFTVSERTVVKMDEAAEKVSGSLSAALAELDAHLKKGGPELNVMNLAGNVMDLADEGLEALGWLDEDTLVNSFDEYEKTTKELQGRVDALLKEQKAILQERLKKLNGLTGEAYLAAMEEVQRELEIIEQAEKDIKQRAEEAKAKAEQAEKAAKEAEEHAADVKRRTEETRKSMAETAATKKTINSETDWLENQLAELRNKVNEMTDTEIEDLLTESNTYARQYGKNTPKGSYYRRRARTLRDERLQRKYNKQAPAYIEWLRDAGQRAFADGRGTTAEINKLLDIYEKAKQTTTKQDDELSRALLMMIDLERVKNKKQREKIRAIQNNLGR